jgi:hypothetical protein
MKDPSRLEKTIYEVLVHDAATTALPDILIPFVKIFTLLRPTSC